MTHDAAFWFHTSSAVLRRPHLWPTAFRQARRSVGPRWWAQAPFFPLPDRDYVRYRLETAYGAHAPPKASDVVRYLEWCRTAAATRG